MLAEPLIDTIDDVLDRMLTREEDKVRAGPERPETTAASAAPITAEAPKPRAEPMPEPRAEPMPNPHTPQEEFYLPILDVIYQANGKIDSAKVLDKIGEAMKNRLNGDDHLEVRKNLPRWRKTAQHARLSLIGKGLMTRQNEGFWEITAAGIVHLKAR